MKRTYAFVLTVVLLLSLAGCGSTAQQAEPPVANEPKPVTNEPAPEPPAATPVSLSSRPGAIDFEDGNISFIAVDEAPAKASGEVSLSVEEINGSKALKIENADTSKSPYVAIDASSLLGDRITDLRTLEATVTTKHPDGKFYAASGKIYGYCGEERDEVTKAWAVYLENKNPNLAKFEMTKEAEYMIAGNFNFFVFSVEEDNGEGVILYIDDICFLDASGNVLPVDTSITFDKPAGFGETDLSNLVAVTDETDLGYTGSSSGWGQAVSIDTTKAETGTFDIGWIYPGCVLTIYYASETPPEVIIQSWSGGANGWAKVEPFTVNDSGTIAQFSYDDMIAAFVPEDEQAGAGAYLEAYFDKFNIGDTGGTLDVQKVTIGKAE